jgi:hypothetical protein
MRWLVKGYFGVTKNDVAVTAARLAIERAGLDFKGGLVAVGNQVIAELLKNSAEKKLEGSGVVPLKSLKNTIKRFEGSHIHTHSRESGRPFEVLRRRETARFRSSLPARARSSGFRWGPRL